MKQRETIEGKNGGRLNRPQKGDPSPNPNGRPKGTRNRATIVKEFLDVITAGKNPLSGEDENLSVEQRMTLAMIGQVINKGNVQAYNAILDNRYGKQKDSVSVESPIILEYVRPAKPPEN
jgi:hypothetical protein